MSPLAICLGCVVAFVIFNYWYNSRFAVRARVKKWERRFRGELKQLSTEELKGRIRESSYFQLSADRSIRDAETVKRFLAQLDTAEPPNAAHGFIEAERSIGYRNRPMIFDYLDEFNMILEELKARTSLGRV